MMRLKKLNSKTINFINNWSYVIASNFISLIISTIIVLIVPKLIGVEEYGYWQLYIFYVSYVGLLHFGWNDGVYLRYGGKEYGELDKKLFFSQFYMLFILQVLIAIILFIVSILFITDPNKIFIFRMTAFCLVIVNTKYMLLYVLQSTNRIKEYAKITIVERVLYVSMILVLLFVGIREYKLLIAADLIGKLISLFYAMYFCNDMVFGRISTFYFSFKETIENISSGIKLMFSNLSSIFIIGVVRFGIERTWDIATFGKVSLTLSISNFLLIFINAVGIILFPILRRTDPKRQSAIYSTMRDLLMVILLGVLVAYYPLKVALTAWLPQYSDSLIYMALVFPICVYEGKMALLINTYLKTLRKENLMMKINLISLSLSLIITFVTTIMFEELNLAILSIVILLAFRSILSEIYLSKILQVSLCKDIVLELMIIIIFILTGWFVNSWFAVLLYAMSYGVYLVVKKNDIKGTIQNLKLLTRT